MAEPFSVTASVLGVAQFGLSVAKILKQYVGDYRNAGKDIRDFANEVETTFQQAKQLQTLIDTNDQTRRFDATNLVEAQKCCLKSKDLGDELWEFLKKKNGGEMPKEREVKEDDVQLSLFNRATWSSSKPWVVEKHNKFHLLKLDMLAVLMFSQHTSRYVNQLAE